MYDIKYDTTHHDGLTLYTFTDPVSGAKKSGISTKVARMYLDEWEIEELDDEMAIQRAIEIFFLDINKPEDKKNVGDPE